MFTRVRTINGKQYLYEEYRWREGGKVRSKSISLGRVDKAPPLHLLKRKRTTTKQGLIGLLIDNLRNGPGVKAMEMWEEKANEAAKAERAKWDAFKAKEAQHAAEQKPITLTPPSASSPSATPEVCSESAPPSEQAADAVPASDTSD
jgi:hypothetical protein